MSETSQQSPPTPTYYANFVTSVLTADDLVMELRRFDRPHRESSSSGLYTLLSPVALADIMNREPVARVVMTFSAAKALKDYLNNALPRIEEVRKTGEPLQ
jgi:hypothetical protein